MKYGDDDLGAGWAKPWAASAYLHSKQCTSLWFSFVDRNLEYFDERSNGCVVVLRVFVRCLVFAVNGYPKEDMIESLPGQPKVAFRQYPGYADVDLKNGSSFFYYFVEAEKHPDHMPLALWLNGGWFLSFIHSS